MGRKSTLDSLPLDERIKERIRFYTEMIKLTAVLLITTSGSVITLLITTDGINKAALFIALGIVIVVVCVVVLYKLISITLTLINNG